MAILSMNFYSQSLARIVEFKMILPNDVPRFISQNNPHYKRPAKTLYLLHGYSCNSSDWMTGSNIQELAGKYNLAVIMPSGENSFYLNAKGTGHSYCTYIGEELVAYTRATFGLSERKENTLIGGLSMGGFGALHTGMTYPETFGGIIALSSALIIYDVKGMKEGESNEVADYDYYHAVFGDLDTVDRRDCNPEVLIQKLLEKGEKLPRLYMACGEQDFLLENNRRMAHFLEVRKVPDFVYRETPGAHDWKFWNEHLEPGIGWVLKEAE